MLHIHKSIHYLIAQRKTEFKTYCVFLLLASKTNAHRYRRLWCSYAFVLWAYLIPLILCFAIESINKICISLSLRRLNYSLIWHFIWKINLISVTLSKRERMKYSSGAKKKKWGVTVSHLEKAKRQKSTNNKDIYMFSYNKIMWCFP